MKKLRFALSLGCALCLALAACMSTGTGSGSEAGAGPQARPAATGEPDYLLLAKSDNGFIPAYRGCFAISGGSVTEISSRKYDELTLGSDTDYEAIGFRTYAFDVDAVGGDPLGWQYVQNAYDDRKYDTQLLSWDLKQMGLSYRGTLYVLVTTFDDYRVILAANMDGNSVLNETYAVFHDEDRLPLPKGARLYGLSRFYRHK